MLVPLLGSLLNLKDFSSKYLKSQIQYLFLLILIALIPWLLKFLVSFTSIVSQLKSGNPTYPWPPYTDFLKSLAISGLLLSSLSIFKKLFKNSSNSLISRKYQGEDREFRRQKLVDCVFKGSFYVGICSYGYLVVKDCDFFPLALGGKGSSANMFNGYPYQEFAAHEDIKFYLTIQLGYHIFSLVQHMLNKAKNDYIDMLLHHFMTVALVGLAYFMNYLAISVLVLLVHDISDVFGYLVRIFIDTEYKNLTVLSYAGLLVSWLYFRLIVLPFEIMRFGIYLNPIIQDLNGYLLLGVMLHCLIILHVYWYYLFIQMGIKFMKSKTAEDTYHVE